MYQALPCLQIIDHADKREKEQVRAFVRRKRWGGRRSLVRSFYNKSAKSAVRLSFFFCMNDGLLCVLWIEGKKAIRKSQQTMVKVKKAKKKNRAEMTAPPRIPLKTCNKFTWTENHTTAFNATKAKLVSKPTLAFYHLELDLRMETDAFALKALGFAQWQRHGEQWRTV